VQAASVIYNIGPLKVKMNQELGLFSVSVFTVPAMILRGRLSVQMMMMNCGTCPPKDQRHV
jgi:hypothetical protein